MSSPRTARSLVALAALAGTCAAQPPAAVPLPAACWRAPIHTLEGDAGGGAYGWWASAASYKVSFHDGFVFHPYVGPDCASLPLRWRTVSVTAGEKELLAPAEEPRHAHTDWRYEYRYAGVVEAYDLSDAGAEQTFTIRDRPPGGGAIVVRGEVTTELTAKRFEARVGRIELADAEGRIRVIYGEAQARDAAGRTAAVTTSFAGRRVELTLDAGFVAAATFPLVIDPLTSAVLVSSSTASPGDTAIGRETQSSGANVLIAYSRRFSLGDSDLYAALHRDDLSQVAIVYTNISTTVGAGDPSVAPVIGSSCWLIAYEQADGLGDRISLYEFPFGTTIVNSGKSLRLSRGLGLSTLHNPRVGGQRSVSPNALVVYQDDSPSANSEVLGLVVAVTSSGTTLIGSEILLAGSAAGSSYDREMPCVNQETTSSWVVGWQEVRTTVADTWTVKIALVTTSGQLVGVASTGATVAGVNRMDPRVAGSGGRYLVTYLNRDNGALFGKSLQAQRFDWSESSTSPTLLGAAKTVASGGAEFLNGALAHDRNTASHWGMLFYNGTSLTTGLSVRAARLGYDGGVAEAAVVFSKSGVGAFAPAITFDELGRTFLISYATVDQAPPQYPIYATKLTYRTDAISIPYGTGCGGAISASTPDRGSEYFSVQLSAGATNANKAAALWIGVAPTSLDLAVIGMPGCFGNVNPLVALNAATDGAGNVRLFLPLPSAVVGDQLFQWGYLSPSVPWPLKLATTPGLRVQIR